MADITKGDCYLCGAHLGKTAMKSHLQDFHRGETGGDDCYLFKIEGAYEKNYWLYVDVPLKKNLSALDGFLRRIWLECCGHLSEFYITPGGKGLALSHFGQIAVGKNRKLENFNIGDKLIHMYDFGSTTESAITFIGHTRRKPQRNLVRLLARNSPPDLKCADCGKEALYVCEEFVEPFNWIFYCHSCGENHQDDDHFLHPVTNSPRMGVCGYTGEYDDYEFCPWDVGKG